jgi:hypothetical protein
MKWSKDVLLLQLPHQATTKSKKDQTDQENKAGKHNFFSFTNL